MTPLIRESGGMSGRFDRELPFFRTERMKLAIFR